MHIFISAINNIKAVITRSLRPLNDKLREHGFELSKKQITVILILIVAMVSGMLINYASSRPHSVAEFSARDQEASGGVDNKVEVNGDDGIENPQKPYLQESGSQKAKSPSASSSFASKKSNNEQSITVHVAGAVAHLGVYKLKDGSRINDAINAAGGGVPMSDINALNLAEKVGDGQKIYVPKRGEIPPPGTASNGVSGTGSAITAGAGATSSSSIGIGAQLEGSKIDLNTATLEQLDTLPGVGQVTAQRILEYRTQHGSFKSVDELKEVDGIGPKKFDQLKPHVVVN
jgi:competence protein ComEA